MRHALIILLLVSGLCHATTNDKPAEVNPEVLNCLSYRFEEEREFYVADTTVRGMGKSASKVRFGVRLGLGISNTNFNKGFPKPETKFDVVWKPSYSAGMILRIPVFDKLTLQQEYLYTKLRGEVKDASVNYNLSYLSLPVLLMYEAVPKFTLVFGPHFDLLVQAREKYNGSSTDLTHHIEERSIGGVIGISYKASNTVHVDGRYAQGINHIGIRQGVLAKEFKVESFQLSICVFPFK